MGNSSLVDSGKSEKISFASRILLTHLSEDYAVLKISLGAYLASCSPSIIHEYLWALSELIEKAKMDLDSRWMAIMRAKEPKISD